MKEPTKFDVFEISLRAIGIDVSGVENASEIYAIVTRIEKGWEPTLRDMCEIQVRMQENFQKYYHSKHNKDEVQSSS